MNAYLNPTAISAVDVERILTRARTRPSCCALLVKIRSTSTAEIANSISYLVDNFSVLASTRPSLLALMDLI